MKDIKIGDLVRVKPQFKSWAEDESSLLRELYNKPVLVVATWDRNPKAPKANSVELLAVFDGEDGSSYDPWKGRPGITVLFGNQTREVELEWVTKVS